MVNSTKPGLPPVACFVYYDIPKPGMSTTVTYGISCAEHPDWKFGKPEIMVCVDSQDEAWGFAAAWLAEAFRGEKSFKYGSLFTTDARISKESEMQGFFVFAPPILDREEYTVILPTKTVFISGFTTRHILKGG